MEKKIEKLVSWLVIVCLLLVNIVILPKEAEAIDEGQDEVLVIPGLLATDTAIFGEFALIPDLETDQSANLIKCIEIAVANGEELYIPDGTYIINQTIPLYSNVQIKGNPFGTTILKNTTGTEVGFECPKNQYPNRENISITNLFLDDLYIYTQLVDNLTIENNIFYHPSSKFVVSVNKSNGAAINNNIFLRDQAHVGAQADWGRTIYIGGYATPSRYQWTENVEINNNIFGVKLSELDAVKSFSPKDTVRTILRLQSAINQNKVTLANEQHFIVTGINSFNNLRQTVIEHNLFYSCYEDYQDSVLTQDHAIYLRGSQDIYFANNHVRGFHNGPAGGIKFKSGRNITIVNNYLRNTGMIFYATAEYGLGTSYEEGKISELSHIFAANNVFDWKNWDGAYSYGVEYHSEYVENPDMHDLVFIDNEYINFHNIPENRRIGFTKVMGDGFPSSSTYIDNTRDDTTDGVLGVQYWTEEDYAAMPTDWQSLLGSDTIYQYYLAKITEPMPYQDMLPVGLNQVIELGETIDENSFVTNTYRPTDEAAPTYSIDLAVLDEPGVYQIPVTINYSSRFARQVVVDITVTVQDTVAPVVDILNTRFERGSKITPEQIASMYDLDAGATLTIEPTIDSLSVGVHSVTLVAVDTSGNETRQVVEIEIYKSALQLEIEALFNSNGGLQPTVTLTTIEQLEQKAQAEPNETLRNDYLASLNIARQLLSPDKPDPVPTDPPATPSTPTGEGKTPTKIPNEESGIEEPTGENKKQLTAAENAKSTTNEKNNQTLPKTLDNEKNQVLLGIILALIAIWLFIYFQKYSYEEAKK